MNNRLENQVKIPISWCDNHSKLNICSIFNIFMDLATEHGEEIGVGRDNLIEKGYFWVASKTKIKINKKPATADVVHTATWPEVPSRIRCNRYYSIFDDDSLLVEGKTEWVVVDIKSGRPVKVDGIYPADMEHCPDTVCEDPFCRLSTNFDNCEKLAEYTVCSTDIDVSQHMNNVAYIRAVLGAFTTKEIDDMDICEIDVAYRTQCYEGEKLSFFIKREEKCCETGIVKEDGTTACVVRFAYR